MRYSNVIKGTFINRPNRFVAEVLIDRRRTFAHVKNTGRCKELLVSGATVYLEDFTSNMGKRKYAYSLVGVEKQTKNGKILINMDSQAPNKVIKEAFETNIITLPNLGNINYIKPEFVLGSSRLDFFVTDIDGNEGYVEVKGVTLENNGIASFPDAPTERGIKHINELSEVAKSGKNAYIIFVIQMSGPTVFTPNYERHAAFAEALCDAEKHGVNILAYDCKVTHNTLDISHKISINLDAGTFN